MRNLCKRLSTLVESWQPHAMKMWCAYVVQRHSDRNIVKRWLSMILNRETAAAWMSWKRFVNFSRAQDHTRELDLLKRRYAEKEKEAQRLRLDRVVRRFKHQHILSAFHGWQEFIHLRKRYRRFAAKIFRHSLVRAFDRWYDNATENKRMRLICQRVLRRITQRKLASSFHAWCDNAHEQKRMRAIGQRVVKKLLARRLSACFASWAENVDEIKRLRNVGRRIVIRLTRRQLIACFDFWHEAAKSKFAIATFASEY